MAVLLSDNGFVFRFNLFDTMKALGNRAYNIFFHTHTVSGIVISALLYIIFFAGAFTLFKEEFYLWENPAARKLEVKEVKIEQVIDKLVKTKPTLDLNEDLYITFPSEDNPLITIYGHLFPGKDGKEIHYATKMNPATLAVYDDVPSTVGETLYRLHFLDQLPLLGRWLAGFVSLFFIFAVVTGVLIHWKNIFTKFWAFSFRGSWKQIWTNTHTVFGLIGLPFQLMYAVTGAFYLLLLLVLLPAVMFFYGGKTEKIYAMVYPYMALTYDEAAPAVQQLDKVASIYDRVKQTYSQDYNIVAVNTRHAGKADGAVNFRLTSRNPEHLISYGYIGYRISDGTELYSSMPGPEKTYTHSVVEALGHLHFASFGGIIVRVLYFIMALLTCFVIIGGVLLWKEARNNRNYTDKQKRFHHRVTMVYLAICLGLFPAVAFLFSAELWIAAGAQHKVWVESVFFVFWLLLVIGGLFFKTENQQLRFYLWVGGVLSLLIPVSNGIRTGGWLWTTISTGSVHVFVTDLFWLLTGICTLWLAKDAGYKRLSSGDNRVSGQSKRESKSVTNASF